MKSRLLLVDGTNFFFKGNWGTHDLTLNGKSIKCLYAFHLNIAALVRMFEKDNWEELANFFVDEYRKGNKNCLLFPDIKKTFQYVINNNKKHFTFLFCTPKSLKSSIFTNSMFQFGQATCAQWTK